MQVHRFRDHSIACATTQDSYYSYEPPREMELKIGGRFSACGDLGPLQIVPNAGESKSAFEEIRAESGCLLWKPPQQVAI